MAAYGISLKVEAFRNEAACVADAEVSGADKIMKSLFNMDPYYLYWSFEILVSIILTAFNFKYEFSFIGIVVLFLSMLKDGLYIDSGKLKYSGLLNSIKYDKIFFARIATNRFFHWQIGLFIVLLFDNYIFSVPAILFYNILDGTRVSNILNDTGLIGAIIGGLCSIIAVTITMKSTNQHTIEKNIELAEPKLFLTTVPGNIEKIVGYGTTGFTKNVYEEKKYSYYVPLYIVNLGGDAIDIDLWNSSFSVNTSWSAYSLTQGNTLDLSHIFPILKNGEGLEVRLEDSLNRQSNVLKYKIEYSDVFTNRYQQLHTMENTKFLYMRSSFPDYKKNIHTRNIYRMNKGDPRRKYLL